VGRGDIPLQPHTMTLPQQQRTRWRIRWCHIALLASTLFVALTPPTLPAAASTNNDTSPSSSSYPPQPVRDPFDPRDYTLSMSAEERVWRAMHQPGGEESYCCCLCGRTSEEDVDVLSSRDSWLFAPLASGNNPTPEYGDPTYRIMQQRLKIKLTRQRGKQGRALSPLTDPSADSEPRHPQRGIAQWYIYRTIETRCGGELCARRSPMCVEAHMWTGWSGGLLMGHVRPPRDVLKERCQSIYEKDMEALSEFQKMALGESP